MNIIELGLTTPCRPTRGSAVASLAGARDAIDHAPTLPTQEDA